MRILLDECMPRLLKDDIVGHEVFTIRQMGWAGTKNGKLLSALETAGFDVLSTIDRNVEHQQNLRGRKVALVVMLAPSKLSRLRPLIPALLEALTTVEAGEVIHVGK